MKVIQKGTKLNKKIFEWECNTCGSIISTDEDDKSLIWDYASGRDIHVGDFHYMCPVCKQKCFTSTHFRNFKISNMNKRSKS